MSPTDLDSCVGLTMINRNYFQRIEYLYNNFQNIEMIMMVKFPLVLAKKSNPYQFRSQGLTLYFFLNIIFYVSQGQAGPH